VNLRFISNQSIGHIIFSLSHYEPDDFSRCILKYLYHYIILSKLHQDKIRKGKYFHRTFSRREWRNSDELFCNQTSMLAVWCASWSNILLLIELWCSRLAYGLTSDQDLFKFSYSCFLIFWLASSYFKYDHIFIGLLYNKTIRVSILDCFQHYSNCCIKL